VGHGSWASVGSEAAVEQKDIVAQLEDFLHRLDEDGPAIPGSADIRDLAETARDEASKQEPKWRAVRSILTSIADRLPPASALTTIIVNVQTLVGHTIH
jgi:hypothetical protein